MEETIASSIESTLEMLKKRETGTSETSPSEYRFKMGHRKKAIQAVENSFVVMLDRTAGRDTSPLSSSSASSTPQKKAATAGNNKFARSKSDLECFVAARRKMREKQDDEESSSTLDRSLLAEKDAEGLGELIDLSPSGEKINELEHNSSKCDVCGCLFLSEGKLKICFISFLY